MLALRGLGTNQAPSCRHRRLTAHGGRLWGERVGDSAAPPPDVVDHGGLEDTEEPVLLGVLWPFLHFSPGGWGWRERGEQISRLQDNVLVVLPETKGSRGRVINGSRGSHSSLTVAAKQRHLTRLRTISEQGVTCSGVGGSLGDGCPSNLRITGKEEQDEEKDVPAFLHFS